MFMCYFFNLSLFSDELSFSSQTTNCSLDVWERERERERERVCVFMRRVSKEGRERECVSQRVREMAHREQRRERERESGSGPHRILCRALLQKEMAELRVRIL